MQCNAMHISLEHWKYAKRRKVFLTSWLFFQNVAAFAEYAFSIRNQFAGDAHSRHNAVPYI